MVVSIPQQEESLPSQKSGIIGCTGIMANAHACSCGPSLFLLTIWTHHKEKSHIIGLLIIVYSGTAPVQLRCQMSQCAVQTLGDQIMYKKCTIRSNVCRRILNCNNDKSQKIWFPSTLMHTKMFLLIAEGLQFFIFLLLLLWLRHSAESLNAVEERLAT